MMTIPVHGSDFISSPVLFPCHQTGNYDTAFFALDCARSGLPFTYRAGAGDVEACPTGGDLAGARSG